MSSTDPNDTPQEPSRAIELEVEVPGTPEEVWRAIATGPGISSWYVPHTVEERAGGAAHASFGPEPEMQIPGRVAAWEPPHRIVFTGVDDTAGGLAFEWLIEARESGTCVVRLVNTGFGSGEDWDAQYDGMTEGWRLFLANLRLHLTHFAGRTATSMLPMGVRPGTPADVWPSLTAALGIASDPPIGSRVELRPTDELHLAGTVIDKSAHRLTLLVDEPAPGTAFVAAEAMGPQTGVSVWAYLYDDAGAAATARDEAPWRAWLLGEGPHA